MNLLAVHIQHNSEGISAQIPRQQSNNTDISRLVEDIIPKIIDIMSGYYTWDQIAQNTIKIIDENSHTGELSGWIFVEKFDDISRINIIDFVRRKFIEDYYSRAKNKIW